MKAPPPHMAMCVAVSMMALPCPSVLAQTGKAENPESPPNNFQVLRGWKFDLGERAIFLNRVAPPILPSEPPLAPATTVVESASAKRPNARTPQRKNELLFLSATVCEHSVTEARMFAGGGDCRFFFNIDFNLLAGLGSFETADTSYLLILAVENRTRAETDAFNNRAGHEGGKAVLRQIPSLESFSKTHSEYTVANTGAEAPPPAETLAALDGLLAFYDANRTRLAEEHAKREAVRITQEQGVKEHPPVSKDTVIHYWKNGTIPPPPETKEKQ